MGQERHHLPSVCPLPHTLDDFSGLSEGQGTPTALMATRRTAIGRTVTFLTATAHTATHRTAIGRTATFLTLMVRTPTHRTATGHTATFLTLTVRTPTHRTATGHTATFLTLTVRTPTHHTPTRLLHATILVAAQRRTRIRRIATHRILTRQTRRSCAVTLESDAPPSRRPALQRLRYATTLVAVQRHIRICRTRTYRTLTRQTRRSCAVTLESDAPPSRRPALQRLPLAQTLAITLAAAPTVSRRAPYRPAPHRPFPPQTRRSCAVTLGSDAPPSHRQVRRRRPFPPRTRRSCAVTLGSDAPPSRRRAPHHPSPSQNLATTLAAALSTQSRSAMGGGGCSRMVPTWATIA